MSVDEILADPSTALGLPDGAVPTHIVLCVEYLEPASDDVPDRARLSYVSDDGLPPWTATGMLRFAEQMLDEPGDILIVDDD